MPKKRMRNHRWSVLIAVVAALAAGLYYVSWKLHYRQVVRIADSSLSVEAGHKSPEKCWQLDRARAALAIEAAALCAVVAQILGNNPEKFILD